VRSKFRRRLLEWAAKPGNLRDFPWRRTKDSYQLLIAELFLRRTNAKAVSAVFQEFISKYPTLDDFALAPDSELRDVGGKLGLYWRAANLTALAKCVRETIDELPTDIEDLEGLPGVGPYVSRAVAINSCGAKTIAIDVNVVRVLCRYFDIRPSDGLRRNKDFQAFADSFIELESSRIFNFALLDFAASVCRAKRPACAGCPMSKSCKFALKG
jgi:A/G-specific adenine glycosylase